MADESVGLIAENRQDWFWMLVSYMKMKTYALWLSHYPGTTFEHFELIWPVLFDQMLTQATAYAVERLKEHINEN